MASHKVDDILAFNKTRTKFLRLLEGGNFREAAAAAVGIPSRTLRHWMQLADGDGRCDPKLRELASLVHEAEAKAESQLVKLIVDAAKAGHWQAAAWILERRGAKRWLIKRNLPEAQADEQHARKVTISVVALATTGPDELGD